MQQTIPQKLPKIKQNRTKYQKLQIYNNNNITNATNNTTKMEQK